jgi:hypothetical protein
MLKAVEPKAMARERRLGDEPGFFIQTLRAESTI